MKNTNYTIATSDIECVRFVSAFTPNGDDYNDTWIIENLDLYPDAEVLIFNRWGSKLFESKGAYSPWDGTFQGNALHTETYYYVVNLNNGVKNTYAGTVTIVR